MFFFNFFNENVWISIEILLKFVHNGSNNNITALFRVVASRGKRLSEPMINKLPTHICVTRPQWFKVHCMSERCRYGYNSPIWCSFLVSYLIYFNNQIFHWIKATCSTEFLRRRSGSVLVFPRLNKLWRAILILPLRIFVFLYNFCLMFGTKHLILCQGNSANYNFAKCVHDYWDILCATKKICYPWK